MNLAATPMTAPQQLMRSIIQRIATGPELSKNISREEARLGMQAILDHQVDPVQAAIFLIALRMKRETEEENKGILDAVLAASAHVTAEVDEVVDIADPYDGYNRCLPAAPLLAPLLAELGVAVVTHSVESVGPKFGVTARHVYRALGLDVDLKPAEVARRLADPALGWGYIDQASFSPALHELTDLRRRIVKRPALTTVEVAAKPILGRLKTHLVTGFVHKPYPPVYAMLARHAGFDSALVIRGVEGGVIPSLRQGGKYFRYGAEGAGEEVELDPARLGIDQSARAVPLPEHLPRAAKPGDDAFVALDTPATAQAAAVAGMAALQGEKGATHDSLVLGAALVLHHIGRAASLEAAADAARAVLDSGRAAARVK